MHEFEAGTLGSPEGAERTFRERLGKPNFRNEKVEWETVIEMVSDLIDYDIGTEEKVIKAYIGLLLHNYGKDNLPRTPAAVALKICLNALGHPRHTLLKDLITTGIINPISIGGLDVLKGYKEAFRQFNQTYNILDQSQLSGVGKNIKLVRKDPEGIFFLKGVAEFWSSPLRVSDGSIKPYEVPVFIAAGAGLAAQKYERVYPVAERVLSSSK